MQKYLLHLFIHDFIRQKQEIIAIYDVMTLHERNHIFIINIIQSVDLQNDASSCESNQPYVRIVRIV